MWLCVSRFGQAGVGYLTTSTGQSALLATPEATLPSIIFVRFDVLALVPRTMRSTPSLDAKLQIVVAIAPLVSRTLEE